MPGPILIVTDPEESMPAVVNAGLSLGGRLGLESRIAYIDRDAPVETIAEEAEAHGVSLVIVGSEERHEAVELVRRAPCAVLTVDVRHPWELPARLLCATDFEEDSSEAEVWAARLAGALGAELSVIHVDDFPVDLPSAYARNPGALERLHDLRETVEARGRRLEELAREVGAGPSAVHARLVSNVDTAAGILDAAREARAELLVLGTHGRHGLSRAFHGSVSEATLDRAGTSVLTVRGPRPSK